MIAIMIPNILFAIKCRDGFDNRWKNKPVELMEQIGRFACLGFMVVNIPRTWFGFGSDRAFAIYRIVDSALVALYWGIWALCFRRNGVFRSLALSILPSAVFLFSGAMSRYGSSPERRQYAPGFHPILAPLRAKVQIGDILCGRSR